MKSSSRNVLPESIDPLLFHTHHTQHNRDVPFWLDMAGIVPGMILELGCGSGRITSALANAGYQVFGLDRDFEMLSFLRRNLPQSLFSRVKLIQADFINFNLALQFGLQIMPCNTFSTLSPSTRLHTLHRIHHHLRQEGIFAASMPNPHMLMKVSLHGESEVEDILTHPISGDPIQVSSSWIKSQKLLTVFWHYDHLLPDGRVNRFTAQTSHSLEPVEVVREDFITAGMTITNQYGDYDYSPYRVDSPFWIVMASRA